MCDDALQKTRASHLDFLAVGDGTMRTVAGRSWLALSRGWLAQGARSQEILVRKLPADGNSQSPQPQSGPNLVEREGERESGQD